MDNNNGINSGDANNNFNGFNNDGNNIGNSNNEGYNANNNFGIANNQNVNPNNMRYNNEGYNNFTKEPFYNQRNFNGNGGNNNGNFILSKYDIKRLRHSAEMPLYRALQVINVLFIVAVIVVFCLSFTDNVKKIQKTYTETVESYNNDEQIDTDKVQEEIPTNVQLLVTIIFIVPYLLFALAYAYAQVRARSVKITPNQFPEIYNLINEYAYRFNMPVPEAYIVQENGILNAFSSFVVRKKYIQINADLFEVAYREYGDIGSIGFVIAHEMAHIKLGHASLPYQLWILWGGIVPFLGQTASRTREFSCDRLAQVVSGNDGIEAMMALTVGKHLYKNVNVQDYINESVKVDGFFVGIYNLLSTHPILPKRIKALVIKDRSGDLF